MTWDFLLHSMAASRRLASATIAYYQKAVRIFTQRFPDLEPLAVEERHLAEFLRGQKNSPKISENTARARVRAVSLVLAWAHRRGLLLVNPGQHLRTPKAARPIPAILSRQEVEALLAAPFGCNRIFIRYRDRAILELFYANGLRAGEVSALDLCDVDLAESFVKVRGGKGKPRCSPLNEQSVASLKAYLDEARLSVAEPGEQALFLTMTGVRMTSANLSSQLHRYGQQLGIAGVTPHALRRALATHLLENGANIVEIKALLGHADISSTQFYAQVRPLEMLSEHRRYHPRARRRKGKGRET